jgi:hypothetical protein
MRLLLNAWDNQQQQERNGVKPGALIEERQRTITRSYRKELGQGWWSPARGEQSEDRWERRSGVRGVGVALMATWEKRARGYESLGSKRARERGRRKGRWRDGKKRQREGSEPRERERGLREN